MDEIAGLSLEAGSMGPKVAAAGQFAAQQGGPAVIGALEQLAELIAGRAGTVVSPSNRVNTDQTTDESGL